MEDHCSMPSLQDMLDDLDGKRLEELAESLLADVTTCLEDDVTGSSITAAQGESDAKPLFGPMVGTKTEELEPCQDTNGSLSTPTRRSKPVKKDLNICVLPSSDSALYLSQENLPINQIDTTSAPIFSTTDNLKENTITSITDSTKVNEHSFYADDDTLYGTYDEENNCITIVLPDEDISNFEEVIEEAICSDEDDEYISITSPNSNNILCLTKQDNEVKSPYSTMTDRDSAYDSLIGSPPPQSIKSHTELDDDFYYDGMWSDSFSELFPSLA